MGLADIRVRSGLCEWLARNVYIYYSARPFRFIVPVLIETVRTASDKITSIGAFDDHRRANLCVVEVGCGVDDGSKPHSIHFVSLIVSFLFLQAIIKSASINDLLFGDGRELPCFARSFVVNLEFVADECVCACRWRFGNFAGARMLDIQ